MFNFSSSQLIIDESIGEYLNLSIVKIGKNEANVTVKIGVDLESSESASTTQRGITILYHILIHTFWIDLIILVAGHTFERVLHSLWYQK